MKKLIAVGLFAVSSLAFAACPVLQPYGCTPGPNGKMICGCGR